MNKKKRAKRTSNEKQISYHAELPNCKSNMYSKSLNSLHCTTQNEKLQMIGHMRVRQLKHASIQTTITRERLNKGAKLTSSGKKTQLSWRSS